jgi:hypothetical protein
MFAWEHLRAGERLLRSWRDGTPGPAGYADDHALLASGLLVLYEATGDLTWFRRARALCDELGARFHDPDHGGFYQTADDGERLIVRPKDLYDNAVPGGNSAAADVLLRMTLLTGDTGYERAAAGALRLVRDAMMKAPSAFGHALCALDTYLGPSSEVAIVGTPGDPETHALVREVAANRFLPRTVLAIAAPDDQEAADAIALLADRPQRDGRPTAYVCRNFVCDLPVTEPADLATALDRAILP